MSERDEHTNLFAESFAEIVRRVVREERRSYSKSASARSAAVNSCGGRTESPSARCARI